MLDILFSYCIASYVFYAIIMTYGYIKDRSEGGSLAWHEWGWLLLLFFIAPVSVPGLIALLAYNKYIEPKIK